ncbi:hypothetical protein [Commensalibacter nepenthis]|uniref:hypothetical protein n=1 Tax=Commensalibacter nepenthis TaxID=3043872 RepID=UPI0038D1771E
MICFIQIIPSIIISIVTYFIAANQYRYNSYYGGIYGIEINDFANVFGMAFVMSFLVVCIYCLVLYGYKTSSKSVGITC